MDRLATIVAVVLCTMFLAVLARIVKLQVDPEPRLAAYAKDRVAVREVQGYRGELLDRRGRLLSTSRIGYRLFVDPEELDREKLDATIVRLASITGEPAETVGERIVRAVSLNDERRALIPKKVHQPRGVLPLLRSVLVGHGSGGEAEPREGDAAPMSGGPAVEEPAAPSGAAGPDDGLGGEGEPASPSASLIRYVAVGGVLDDDRATEARNLTMRGVHLERRLVREYPGGDPVASIVGKVGFENTGLMGVEKTLEAKLHGTNGQARYVRDATGNPLWIEHGQWTPASHGASQRLSIDLELQSIAQEELQRGLEHADAAGGLLLLVDPESGEILAMVDILRDLGALPEFPWIDAKPEPGAPKPPAYDPFARHRYRTLLPDPSREIHPALGRNRCVEDIYEPGSIFKPLVWSLVTESGLAKIDEVFDTEGGTWIIRHGRSARTIKDVTKRPQMTWSEVLINSSNIGMIKGASRLSFDELRTGVLGFGIGSRTGIGLPGESAGMITPPEKWSHWTQESVAHGNEVSVTVVQMARAYCAFARSGDLAGTIPTLHLMATGPDASERDGLIRVLPPDIATLTRHTIRHVAEAAERNMLALNPPESGWRYQMFGKSGTAEIPLGAPPEGKRRPPGSSGYFDGQYNSSFIAGAPLEKPRLLVVVVINDPGPEAIAARHHYGSWVAAPIARRVLERSLTYLGVDPDVPAAPADGATVQAAATR
ncbi:MAG: penicillin-binding protein 2 [Phycisphaerales bacterium]|nr:penicillin-binding protein 2 [Phycisphaerales bacterium]